jgi:nicotinate-nucleotide adenylyltransferase
MSDGETGTPDSLVSRPGRVWRLGVMGGTFDPIHHGHLVAASEVAHVFDLDEVVFVPTGEPWQKDHRKVSSSEDRYLITVIATASNPRFSVSRVDIDRPGPTYTIDTLRELRALRGEQTEFFFITGADALSRMMSWQDAADLFKLAHFVGCTRPGHQLSTAGLPSDQVSLIEIPALSISSTECRCGRAGLVPGPRRRGAVHRQARAVLRRRRDSVRA